MPAHSHIVRYKRCDVGVGGADFYIFSEYCMHGSVRDRFNHCPAGLVETEIRKHVQGTLLGLEYLHKQGMSHGNLKCSNMLIDHEGNTRLGDYSLPNSIRKLGLKAVGGRDPRWQAGEVGEHTATEKRSDIWSLGCTFFIIHDIV